MVDNIDSDAVADVFDRDAYLHRIALEQPVPVTAEGLESVHRAQAYSIPFENFDVLLGRGVDLAPAAVFDKLVNHPRGGYCFELNGLLSLALSAFGFEVRPLLARVHLSGTPSGRGHMLLLVIIDGRPWIADVGFGGPGLRAPIPLELERRAHQDGKSFRLVEADPYGIMLQTESDGAWQSLYSFDLGHVVAADIAMGNHYTSTHPSAFFTYARVAALPRPDGRVTLYDSKLTTTVGAETHERTVERDRDLGAALQQEFGIVLDAPLDALPPLRQRAPAGH
jgi:N-hydroxyarylamine O-acetyltransferase